MRGTVGGLDEQLVLKGRQAVIDYFNEIVELWDRLEVEIENVVDGEDVFVVMTRETGRSARAAVEISTETAVVARVADGSVVELRGYLDQRAALEAAGVPES